MRSTSFTSVISARTRRRLGGAVLVAGALLGAALPARCADPVRGAVLYNSTPAPGLLGCVDCHGSRPLVNNFGNIWAGRHAPSLIRRAVASNTGGMGYLSNYFSSADFDDIASYLGTAPAALVFASVDVGVASAPLGIELRSGTKTSIDALAFSAEGEFTVAGGTCRNAVPRFDSCRIDLAFRPIATGVRSGVLIVSHADLPVPMRVVLTGTGTQAPAAVARIAPGRLSLAPGQRTAAMLANASDVALRIQAVEVSGAGLSHAGGSCAAGLLLAAGERCSVGVARAIAAAPAGPASRITVRHDGQGGRSDVQLDTPGDGRSAPWLFTPTPGLSLGPVGPGPGAAHALTLVNRGAVAWPAQDLSAQGLDLDAAGCAQPLAPGASCQTTLRARPAAPGPASGDLQADRVAVWTDARTSAGPPRAALAPHALVLQGAGGAAPESAVRVANRGGSTLRLAAPQIEGADAAAFAVRPSAACAEGSLLPPETGCTLHIASTPGAAARTTATLRIGDAQVDLVGKQTDGAAPQLHVDATRLDFDGLASGGAPALRTLHVDNRGNAALAWRRLGLVGGDAGRFSLGGGCRVDVPLAPGARCAIDVTATPGPAGVQQAALVLWPADAETAAEIGLVARIDSTPTRRAEVDRTALDFGRVATGAPSAARRVTLRNVGSASLPRPVVQVDPPFRLLSAGNGCAGALAPGGRCSIDVVAAPVAAGESTARLRLTFAGIAPIDVALVATAADSAPRLRWSAQPDALPEAATGTTVEARATLVNDGDAPTGALRWGWSGPDASDFSLAVDGCGAGVSLTPGAACSVHIVFHPLAAGSRTARLTLHGPDGPELDLDVAAVGLDRVQARIAAGPSALVFLAAPGRTPPAQTAWIANDGTASTEITSVALQGDGFERVAAEGAGPACAAPPFTLRPGDRCGVPLRWTGGAEARFGARLDVVATSPGASVSVPLSVATDPADRRNAGGGGAFQLGWLAALALAAAAARRRHGPDAATNASGTAAPLFTHPEAP